MIDIKRQKLKNICNNYSYLNATIGSILEAFIAGNVPDKTPIKNGNTKEKTINCTVIYGCNPINP
jgi:hypothetical protein